MKRDKHGSEHGSQRTVSSTDNEGYIQIGKFKAKDLQPIPNTSKDKAQPYKVVVTSPEGKPVTEKPTPGPLARERAARSQKLEAQRRERLRTKFNVKDVEPPCQTGRFTIRHIRAK